MRVTEFTKIKKTNCNFLRHNQNFNHCQWNRIEGNCHIEGTVFDFKVEKVKFNDDRKVRIREYKVKNDTTAIIKLTMFGDFTEEKKRKVFLQDFINKSCKVQVWAIPQNNSKTKVQQ